MRWKNEDNIQMRGNKENIQNMRKNPKTLKLEKTTKKRLK